MCTRTLGVSRPLDVPRSYTPADSARPSSDSALFFFHHPATTEIYTLSLHDALPISRRRAGGRGPDRRRCRRARSPAGWRSEEHTSELQSRLHLVCRLLLEKKKKNKKLRK